MSSLQARLSERIFEVAGVDPELRPATKPQFGHYQCNVAMRLAKAEGRPPREIAAELAEKLDLDDLCEPIEIAGPGFLNLRLRPEVLAGAVNEVLADPHAGVVQVDEPQTVVIDYSAPNVAKQMHVGHLRSTVIGDCLRRVQTGVGNTVIAQNHIGDWGTQFGMLVEQILFENLDASRLDLESASELYQRSRAHFDSDPEFAERARKRVVALQGGDPQTIGIWQQLIEVSKAGFNEAYDRLGVLLTDDDLAGESTYNDALPEVVADLEDRGVAVVDDGALCIFVEGIEAPLIVRKRDGGYGYGTTDLAAIRHRVRDLGADRIIYVVGAPQATHFKQVFAAARKADYLPEDVDAVHIGFGSVLGTDGKPFKTRAGKTVTLMSLLDEAEEQAAPAVALAAIKYADLSNGLNKDYVFDAERMSRTTGDTGPYLQYAHARTCSVMREAEARGLSTDTEVTVLTQPEEHTLALQLSKFGEAVAEVADTLQPHKLCHYLFELAVAYSSFYQECPVLKSDGAVRDSRLALCRATRTVLARGLQLLGIEALERM
ncbi:arginine--tRNA ligase [Enemella sp. A6]|uniref:arginine--tRNA ligase n=1 Tax=Enemella sp. A6 TaxID=3440152 RepID=UPI003EBACF76